MENSNVETHLRLILFLVGSVILLLIIWDILRQQRLKQQQEFVDLDDQMAPILDDEDRQQFLDFGEETTQPLTNSAELSIAATQPDKKRRDFSLLAAHKQEPRFVKPSVAKVQHTAPQRKPMQSATTLASKKKYSFADMLALFVMAREPHGFESNKLKHILEAANLVYGKMNIFHKYAETNGEEVMFSIASAVEPGFFDFKRQELQFIPGITLFMVFSKVTDPKKAFDSLVKTAKHLAFSLNGELRDQYHKPLTLQTIDHYKELVTAYINK